MNRYAFLILYPLLPLAACASCGGEGAGAEPADGNVPTALLAIESVAEDANAGLDLVDEMERLFQN